MPSQRNETQSSDIRRCPRTRAIGWRLWRISVVNAFANFFMRDFLYSETAALAGLVNYLTHAKESH